MAVIPRATYRLQLHPGFGFEAAERLLPYLDRLGISHVYCSPILRAHTGSTHGYDVVDHSSINPELGGREGFERLSAAARERGMGLLLDMVPNHMGVAGNDNLWWMDVQESGPASAHADFFDINWAAPGRGLEGKLLLPVLGDSYGDVLERGEFKVHLDAGAGRFLLGYFEHRFALDPKTWPALLQAAAGHAESDMTRAAFQALAAQADALPARAELTQAPKRAAALPLLKQRLAALLRDDGAAAGAIDAALADLNSASRFDDLHALHEAQAYRLAYWRIAADEVNYRRFFDINELAALRIENEAVFEATHGLALALTAAGLADGLRIDHPDGLLDPAQYFARLQEGYARRTGTLAQDLPLYVVIEKIAAAHEKVPDDWAVHGATGYRFAMLVNGLFVPRKNGARFERIWKSFSGSAASFAELAYEGRREAAFAALGSELTLLAVLLQGIASAGRRRRDYGLNTLRDAIAEVAACMPVYRTYVVHEPSAQDLRFIAWAVAQARRRSRIADPTLFEFLRRCMQADASAAGDGDGQSVLRFARRFQQFCAPVAAKGVEDTAFYRYHRLVSLNEVGGDPALFGITVAAFHGASADRAAHWPHTMLATSTHDNKRSEDVRARIDVLSESPASWRLGLRRWHTMTRSFRRDVDAKLAPSGADEALLYQTVLGSLPAAELDEAALAAYRERIEQYMLKAAREAKRETSWAHPNEAYEEALREFVHGVLGRLAPNPVLADLRVRADELAWFGALNSVAMSLLKLTSPGVPDLYQGNELIDLSLVDPDNRREVDFALRAQRLEELRHMNDAPDPSAALSGFAAQPGDGRLKLWTIWRLLELRRREPLLLRDGGYVPLLVDGTAREHVVAFARRNEGVILIVIVARLFATLLGQAHRPATGEACWSDTVVDLSALFAPGQPAQPIEAVNVLTHARLTLQGNVLRVADALAAIPFAALRVGPDS